MTKSDKIRKYFRKHPNADVTKVAARFDAPKPMTYKLRKQVQDEPEADINNLLYVDITRNPPATVPVPGANALDVQVAGSHYKDMAIQPVEFVHANGIGYFEGNVIKYVTRWRNKNGIADLEKAKHYIELLIELETRGTK